MTPKTPKSLVERTNGAQMERAPTSVGEEPSTRRLNEREKLSTREIGKRVGVSKDTVCRVLNQAVVAK
jgi:predicted DNA-binding protein (UPF0251 family)